MHMSKFAIFLLSYSTKSSLSKYSMPNERQSWACIYIFPDAGKIHENLIFRIAHFHRDINRKA